MAIRYAAPGLDKSDATGGLGQSRHLARAMAETDGVELDDVKWQQILKAREYYEEHAVVPPIRKFSKYLGADQKEMFKMWMTGPMKPITKYGGLPKPTGCV